MGFMATGKSRVGEELAKLLGWHFVDTDDLIEQEVGKSITRIFAEDGEAAFRQIEKRVVARLAQSSQNVVALGGGAVMDDENWKNITSSGVTICLTASVDLLYERISKKSHRPLMAGHQHEELRQRIESLLAQRLPFYSRAQYKFESRQEVPAEKLAEHIFLTLRDEV